MDDAQVVEAKYRALAGRLDEATLRLWAAAEARGLGRGGVSVVAKAAGVSRTTVYAGLAEIEAAAKPVSKRSKVATLAVPAKRIRAPAAGARS